MVELSGIKFIEKNKQLIYQENHICKQNGEENTSNRDKSSNIKLKL